MEEKQVMRISELARLSGTPRTTIHFYLRKGLLHPPIRTGRTMAYYDETHLERLRLIKQLKMNLRLPTAFIKRHLENMKKPGHGGFRYETQDNKTRPDRKQEIIEVAIRLFSERGYLKTNVRDITDSLGISTGTFYIYFQNKQELFIEVVDDVIRTIIGEIAIAIKKEKDYIKRSELRGRVFFENYPRYSEILAQLRAGIVGEGQWPQEKVKKIYHLLTEPLIREAKEAMQKGVIRKVDPDLLAYTLTGMVETLSMRANLDDKYDFNEVMEFVLDLAINGLKPTDGPMASTGQRS